MIASERDYIATLLSLQPVGTYIICPGLNLLIKQNGGVWFNTKNGTEIGTPVIIGVLEAMTEGTGVVWAFH